MNSWCINLELLIKSRTSLIWMKTKEEERLEKIINFSIIVLFFGIPIFIIIITLIKFSSFINYFHQIIYVRL